MEWCRSYVFDVKLSFIVELNDNVAQAEIGSLQYYGKVYSLQVLGRHTDIIKET